MHAGSVECSSCDKPCCSEGSSRGTCQIPSRVFQVSPHHLALRIEPRYQQSTLCLGPFPPFHTADPYPASQILYRRLLVHSRYRIQYIVLRLLVGGCADPDNPPAACPLHEACISSSELPSHSSSIPCYLLADAPTAVRQCGPDTWHKLFSMGRTCREVLLGIWRRGDGGVLIPGLALAPASYEHRIGLAIQAARERYDLT